MNRTMKLGLCATALGGLIVFTGLRAEDKPKADKAPAAKEEKAEAPKEAKPVKPKELSDTVKKGLEYLAKNQLENGGWNQGGGWRTSDNGGRVEGAQVSDPADLGDTCIALLAFVRAGNTPSEGPYKENVRKALDFIMTKVEKSDDKTLMITDIKGTQMQSKIGPYVDTFLTSMVLAELKGKTGDDKVEKRLGTSLDKTIAKIEKNQKEDGTFAGNNGWASVLSQGLAVRGLNQARQVGAKVSDEALDRSQKQVAASFDTKAGSFKAAGGGSDAGVALYGASANLAGLQQSVNANRERAEQAQKVLEDKDAPMAKKEKAKEELKKLDEVQKVQEQATAAVAKQAQDKNFVRGFGNNGGEEFLSFMNISETLLVKGGDDWEKWDKAITASVNGAQDKDGSWAGHHCITGKTFCTAGALLTLMADRAPTPVCAKKDVKKEEKK
jgi:hypothetical protein